MLLELSLALVAQTYPVDPWQNSQVVYLEDFGGGPGETAADNSTAIESIFTLFSNNNQADGGEIRFNCGEYNFADTIEITRNVRLVGQTGQQFNCTTLHFPNDTAGIHIQLPSTTTYLNANGTTIERLEIEGGGTTNADAHGIWVEAPNVVVRDTRIRLFSGDCIYASADVNRTPPTNANLGELSNVETVNCGGWCFRNGGGDSNAWWISGSNFHACTTGTIYEDAFIGNTWVGNHFDTDGDCGDADPATECGIVVPDTSGRNVFFGNYIEGAFRVDMAAPSIYTGAYGAGTFTNPAAYYERGNTAWGTAKIFVNVDDETEVRVGNVSPGSGMGVLEFDAMDGYSGDRDPKSLRFGYEPGTSAAFYGWWCLYPNNEAGNSQLCIATDQVDNDVNGAEDLNDPEEQGQLWIRGNGYWLGGASGLNSNAADRRLMVGITEAQPTRTDLPKGSFMHYSPPTGTTSSIMGWLWNGNTWVSK